MLVLSRKLREQIQIGDNVTITILRVKGNSVRIGIDAPRDVKVVRGELPRNEELPRAKELETATVGQDDPGCDELGRDELGRDELGRDELGRDELGQREISRGDLELKAASLPADQANMSVFVSHPVDQRVIEISNDGEVRVVENGPKDAQSQMSAGEERTSMGQTSSAGTGNQSGGHGLHQRVLNTERRQAPDPNLGELGAGQNRLRQIADAISKLS